MCIIILIIIGSAISFQNLTNITTCLGIPAEFICVINKTITIMWFINGKDSVSVLGGNQPSTAKLASGVGAWSSMTMPGTNEYNGASIMCLTSDPVFLSVEGLYFQNC